MKNIEQANKSYLKCDKDGCGYRIDVPFESFTQWIDRPCPKCGSNLLTQEDYDRANAVMVSMDFVNTLSPEEIEELSRLMEPHLPDELRKQFSEFSPNENVSMHVETHEEIKIDLKKESSEQNVQGSDTTKV